MVTMEMVTKKTLRKWQKRLGLEDWKIVLKTNVAQTDMVLDNCCGEVDSVATIKAATIRILDPIYCGGRIVPFSDEKTLVHELLHVKMWWLEDSGNDLQDRMTHQLIDDLARALVEAERSGRNDKI